VRDVPRYGDLSLLQKPLRLYTSKLQGDSDDFFATGGGGLEPNKRIHSGVKFKRFVGVSYGPNKRGLC
jgi:hypothetical protein